MKLNTNRAMFSIGVVEDLHLEHIDVKVVFLYGDLKEEIYMLQPEGFTEAGKEDRVVS